MCSHVSPPVLRTQGLWWAERARKSIWSLEGEKQLLRAGCGLWGRGVHEEGRGQWCRRGNVRGARVLGGELAGLSMMVFVDKWEKVEGSVEPRRWPWT